VSVAPPLAGGPRARSGELIVRRLGDETLVYDRATHRAHCLNRAASHVFRRCDGNTSSEELARKLMGELGGLREAEAASLVELGLQRLAEAGLLEKGSVVLEGQPHAEPRSRRAALRALGTAAALPVILSALAPTPADAQTCVPRSGNCTSSQQCCPNAPCCRERGPHPPRCTPGGGNCLP
jgi:hypothetical protein